MAGITFAIQFKGIQELQSMLSDFASSVKGAEMASALELIGQNIADEMQFNCPVDTGLLQSEIGVTEAGPDHVTVESPTGYAGFVNFGTVYQEPQPYFSDAIENIGSNGVIDGILEDLQTMLDNAISRNQPR
jgi:HK97 gp10 family phage protein